MPEFVIFLRRKEGGARPSREIIEKHCQRLNDLSREARYIAGGPFVDAAFGGLIIAYFESAQAAKDFAASEPFVQCGYSTAEVYAWEWSRPENGHLDVLPKRPSSYPSFLASLMLRHTAREFADQPISRVLLEEILAAAIQAPSEFNLQPWRPVVCHAQEDRLRLMRCCLGQSQVGAAAAAIICAVDPQLFLDEAPRTVDESIALGAYLPGEREEKIAFIRAHYHSVRESAIKNGAIFGQQLLLAGFSQGLAGFWLGGFDANALHAEFGIPERVVIVGVIGLGWPLKDKPPRRRRTLKEIIHWGFWDEALAKNPAATKGSC